jgi:thioredoxin 1
MIRCMTSLSRSFTVALPLAALLLGLTGCDKLTQVKMTVEDMVKGAPAAAATPKVSGIYLAEQVSEVTAADFPRFLSRPNSLVVVDFGAAWCNPCNMLAPVLIKATQAHPGVVFLGQVDVEKEVGLAAAQGVSAVPDVRIYRNGRELARFVGFPGEAEVLEKIAGLSKGIIPPPPVVVPAMTTATSNKLPPGITPRGIAPEKKR